MTESTLTTVSTGHGSALVLRSDQERWSEAQEAALRQMGLQDAPRADLDVFMHVAQRTGLDPFARQIHMIGRKAKVWDPETRQERYENRYTIQTGIDGYRVTAARAAARESDTVEYEDTQWCGEDGVWVDAWLNPNVPPSAARVVLVKNGRRYSGTAMYAEYVQTYKAGNEIRPNSMWAKMPAGQLAKCAEALAIRKAYPQDFAALYVDDEMGQADNPPPRQHAEQQPAGGGLAAARGRQRLTRDHPAYIEMFRLFDELSIVGEHCPAFISDTIGRPVISPADLTVDDAVATIAALRDRIENPFPDAVDGEVVPDDAAATETGTAADQ